MSTSSGYGMAGEDDQVTSPTSNLLGPLWRRIAGPSRSEMSTQELGRVHKEESPSLSEQRDGIISGSCECGRSKTLSLQKAEESASPSHRGSEHSSHDWLVPYWLSGSGWLGR